MEKNINTTFRLSSWAHSWGDPILFSVSNRIRKLGFTPNTLTISGFFLCIATAVLIFQGFVRLAGLVLLVAGLCDVLDGPLAKITNQKTQLGSFLDSVLDQLSDAFIYLALGLQYFNQQNSLGLILCFICLISALLVSYIRAKAATLKVEISFGPFGRFERTLFTIVGFMLNQVFVLLVIVSILSIYTFLKRFSFSVQKLKSM